MGTDCHKCVICKKGDAYTAHHVTYSRDVLLGNDFSQLFSVCKSCHKTIEFRNGKKLVSCGQIAGRAMKVTKGGRAGMKKFRPRCVVCGKQRKQLGRDNICMVCYRTGKATKWRDQNADKVCPTDPLSLEFAAMVRLF